MRHAPKVIHLYREENWTAERIARRYPSVFRNQWDVYAFLRRQGLTKKVLTPGCAARAKIRDRVQAKRLSRVKVPLLVVTTDRPRVPVLLRCWSCTALVQQVRCPYCLTLINPTITVPSDRLARTKRTR